jgi:hypothetical protein
VPLEPRATITPQSFRRALIEERSVVACADERSPRSFQDFRIAAPGRYRHGPRLLALHKQFARVATGQRLALVINSARVLFKLIVRLEHCAYRLERPAARREHHQGGERAVIESQSRGDEQWFSTAFLFGHWKQQPLLDSDVPEQALSKFSIGFGTAAGGLREQRIEGRVFSSHELGYGSTRREIAPARVFERVVMSR